MAVEVGVGAEYHAASSGHSSVRCEASWQSGESGIQGRRGGRRRVSGSNQHKDAI